jgi:hypothetical protein
MVMEIVVVEVVENVEHHVITNPEYSTEFKFG